MIKRWTTGAALAAVVLVGVVLTGQRGLEAQDAMSPTTVSVVDLNAVINGSRQYAAMQANQADREARRQEEGQTRQTELEKLKGDLDLLAPGSAAHESKQRELLEKAAGAQAWNNVSQQLENNQRSREFLGLYESANAAAAAVAQDRGIDIVMVTGQLPDLQQLARAEAQQIAAILQNRKVLYAADDVDITQATLARMNADF